MVVAMKDAEDEAFNNLAKRQGAWGGGFPAKRNMAADKLQEPAQEPVAHVYLFDHDGRPRIAWDNAKSVQIGDKLYTTPPLPAQPAQEPEMLTIVYQSGYHDGKKAALAGREWNFCERCGKRIADLTVIHTCTPPQGAA